MDNNLNSYCDLVSENAFYIEADPYDSAKLSESGFDFNVMLSLSECKYSI